jgi:hypothetical protein
MGKKLDGLARSMEQTAELAIHSRMQVTWKNGVEPLTSEAEQRAFHEGVAVALTAFAAAARGDTEFDGPLDAVKCIDEAWLNCAVAEKRAGRLAAFD